tara:strand:- start:144 stop:530 length:387 start_codon:yes stop_codon:yes gene_type:complete
MDITLLQLYNPMLKMSVKLSRTSNKKYKLSKQITPVRNVWVDDLYDNLDDIKGLLIGEIINGFDIKVNNLGIDFIDELLEPINKAIEEDKDKELLEIKQEIKETVLELIDEECIEDELSESVKKGLEL